MTTPPEPLVTIIVLNYNGKKALGQGRLCDVIRCIMNTEYTNFEIAFVDNGSDDDSCSIASELFAGHKNFRVIKLEKNMGFSKGNNEALKRLCSSAKYLVFLNNDVIVAPDWIHKAVERLETDYNIKGVKPLHIEPGGKRYSGVFLGRNASAVLVRDPDYDGLVAYISGASLIIRADAFREMGGFDERYRHYYQDIDLGWRLWTQGYRLVCVPQSIVIHLGGASSRMTFSEAERARFLAEDMWLFVIKNYPSAILIKSLFFIVASEFLYMAYYSVSTRKPSYLMGRIRGNLEIFKRIKELACIRRESCQKTIPRTLFSGAWFAR
jgi:hypothetical protein